MTNHSTIALIILLAWHAVSHSAACQEVMSAYEPNSYSAIPPSPEVSELMKMVDFPVSPFSGRPDITLPLYTVRLGALEVPISISYHAGGLKVAENPGIIGSGWHLNAGGCVSRTVRGLPDEMSVGGTYGIHGIFALTQTERIKERQLRDEFLTRNFHNTYNPAPENPLANDHIMPYQKCQKFNEGRQDLASDIFQFSFLGKTGTFVHNPDNKNQHILSTPSSVRIISGLPDIGGGYTVVDEWQNVYEFDAAEQSCFYYTFLRNGEAVTDTVHYNSAWHLSKITATNGDEIQFVYAPAGEKTFSSGVSQTETRTATSFSGMNPYPTYRSYSHWVRYYPKMLRQIKTPSTIVEFVYDSGYNRLEEIVVYRRSGTPEPVKRIQLEHASLPARQVANDSVAVPHAVGALTGVREVGTDSTSVALYAFTYNTNATPDSLAGGGVDHWGYYNGSGGSIIYQPPFNGRESDAMRTAYGTLTRITYPTGGYTEFDWEQNDYAYQGDTPKTETTSTDLVETRNFRLYGLQATIQEINSNTVASSQFDKSMWFQKESDRRRYLTVDVSTFMDNLQGGTSLITQNSEYYYHHTAIDHSTTTPRVELVSPAGTVLHTWYIDIWQSGQPPTTIELTDGGTYTLKLRYPYNWMQNLYGNYDVEPQSIYNYLVVGGAENASGTQGYIAITQTDHIPQPSRSPLWGGLRIVGISSVADYSADAIEKNYAYVNTWGSNMSSGVILEDPREWYTSQNYTCRFTPLSPAGNYTYEWTSYTTYHSEGLYATPQGGSHVEYPVVYEWLTGDSAVTRYEYTSQRLASCRDQTDCNFPTYINGGARMATSYSHRAGDLISKTILVGDRVAKRQSWDYRLLEQPDVPTLLDGLHPLVNIDGCSISDGNGDTHSSDYVACRYKLIPYNKSVSRQVDEEFDLYAGTDFPPLADTVSFTFFRSEYSDRPSATFPRSRQWRNSDGLLYETFYSYVGRNEDFVSLPETEVTVCQGRVVAARRNVYDECDRLVATFRAPAGLAVSASFGFDTYCYAAEEPLKAAIGLPEYAYKYNEWGELAEVSYNGEVLSSFVWAYKGSHPVAEIKGVSYEQVQAALPVGLTEQNLHGRSDLTPADLAVLRTSFPGHEVTTITYDWLIGIGTMTDPRGITTSFTYDGLGRLNGVKDLNGHYIRKYDYHYANQQ